MLIANCYLILTYNSWTSSNWIIRRNTSLTLPLLSQMNTHALLKGDRVRVGCPEHLRVWYLGFWFSIDVLAPAHLSSVGLQPELDQEPSAFQPGPLTTIWNSYTTKLRPVVATIVENWDYNSNNTTVASAPWTAVHVKQNYNAHKTCLMLFTSFTGTHTAGSFCEINRDFFGEKNPNLFVRGLTSEKQTVVQ